MEEAQDSGRCQEGLRMNHKITMEKSGFRSLAFLIHEKRSRVFDIRYGSAIMTGRRERDETVESIISLYFEALSASSFRAFYHGVWSSVFHQGIT